MENLRSSTLPPAPALSANRSIAGSSNISAQRGGGGNGVSMILRTPTIVALLAAASSPLPSSAFLPHPTAKASGLRPDNGNDGDSDAKNPFLEKIGNLPLPPAPEDKIALSGDVVALFVYSYLDHAANALYAETAAKVDNVADLVALSSEGGGGRPPPVWFDPTLLAAHGPAWLARSPAAHAPYAPAIAHSGLAFVALATSWILCGCVAGAFAPSNTVECAPTRAMTVTLRTWAGTCLLMVSMALGSDALWGALDGINALSAPARGGLTKADADFIFDSLSVLAFWRFMYNWLLGYRT